MDETSPGDDDLPFSNDDAFQVTVASSATGNGTQVTEDEFSKV